MDHQALSADDDEGDYDDDEGDYDEDEDDDEAAYEDEPADDPEPNGNHADADADHADTDADHAPARNAGDAYYNEALALQQELLAEAANAPPQPPRDPIAEAWALVDVANLSTLTADELRSHRAILRLYCHRTGNLFQQLQARGPVDAWDTLLARYEAEAERRGTP